MDIFCNYTVLKANVTNLLKLQHEKNTPNSPPPQLTLLNLLKRYHSSDKPLMFLLFPCEKGISVLTRFLGQVSI